MISINGSVKDGQLVALSLVQSPVKSHPKAFSYLESRAKVLGATPDEIKAVFHTTEQAGG